MLWGLLSVPTVLYLLFRTYVDKAGDTHSEWGNLIYSLQHGPVHEWQYWSETVFWNILVPIVIAWLAQYLLRVGWHFVSARAKAS